jgi:hypothetical protein
MTVSSRVFFSNFVIAIKQLLKRRLWLSYDQFAQDNYVNRFKFDSEEGLDFTSEEFRQQAERVETLWSAANFLGRDG